MDIRMTQDSDSEFKLDIPRGESAWVGVENASIYIKNDDEGISVNIYPKGREDNESVADIWVARSELGEAT